MPVTTTTMSRKTLNLDERLHQYILEHSLREAPILARLREETAQQPMAQMQIAPEQGQFLALLVRLLGARKTLDIGVFTGYSSLVVALALPDDGHLVACDTSEDYTQIARRYWAEAGVSHKIHLHLAPASETLAALIEAGQAGTYDFAFIDADKRSYHQYYEQALVLLRPGGLIAIDNVLWSGRVADPTEQDTRTDYIRSFNDRLHQDSRVELSLLPLADGLTLALKRPA